MGMTWTLGFRPDTRTWAEGRLRERIIGSARRDASEPTVPVADDGDPATEVLSGIAPGDEPLPDRGA